MKLLPRTAVMLSLLAGPLMAQQVMQMQNETVTVVIDRVELKDAASDRVRFDVQGHIIASRKLKIKRVRFEQMHLGRTPIYLSPISSYLELEKGTAVTLPPIPLTLYFRDLDSLEPVEQAVRDGKVTVTGNARVDLDLNLLERAVARQWSVHADMPVAMTAPVDVPGGGAGRAAALATLHAAQLALTIGGAALDVFGQSHKASDDDLRAQYSPAMVIVESRYSLQLRDGHRVDFVLRGLGFRISEDKFVTTGEMVEPWKYDTDAATGLQAGEASLIEDSRDLLVWPAGESPDAGSARSLLRGSIHVERTSNKTELTHVPSGQEGVEVRVARRDSDENYAVLRFTRAEDRGTAVRLAGEEIRRSQSFDRLTLFRVNDSGKLEALSTPAQREEKRIALEDPVDDHGFGSLLIAPDGAVGMVQDERTAMVLRGQW